MKQLNEHDHDEECCCHECKEKQLSEKEIERIIEESYSEKDEKTKVFIRKSLRKFGDRFDYSKTRYINYKTKVILICKIHKVELKQAPSNHIRTNSLKNPCYQCVHESIILSFSDFVKRANKMHNEKYTYDESTYKGSKSKVLITCPIHGNFMQTVHSHLEGSGCPLCSREASRKLNMHSQESTMNKLKELYSNNEYDFSNSIYHGFEKQLKVTCNTCGTTFNVVYKNLLNSKRCHCPNCFYEKRAKSLEQFIKDAKSVHGEEEYSYDEVNYINNITPVKIYDLKLDEFFYQSPISHLSGNGNPNRIRPSIGEERVMKWLKRSKFNYETQVKIPGLGQKGYYKVDFKIYLDETKFVFLEYNGKQHYKKVDRFHKSDTDFIHQLERDRAVVNYCMNNNIKLIVIPYTIKTLSSISDFLTKTIIENIDPCILVDYDSLYVVNENST